MAAGDGAWQRRLAMKSLLIVLALCALLGAALFCPIAGRSFWQRAQAHGIPAAMARGTAHGLRAGWDFLASLGEHARTSGGATQKPPAYSPRHPSRKAQAAAAQPARRTSREGIVPQQPKENLESSDRAALDALLSKPR